LYPFRVRLADVAHGERERYAREVSQQNGGAVTTTDELRLCLDDGYRRNLEIASLARSMMKPIFQIGISGYGPKWLLIAVCAC